MNKSIITNVVAVFIVIVAQIIDSNLLYSIGLFAVSGAITNWLAVHMLFEKVPGLYGSGIIPARFNEFKLGIKAMIMEQFFSAENLTKFLQSNQVQQDIDLTPIIEKVDFAPTFDGLVEVVKSSSFGAMIDMMGGTAALEPMREPFVNKIQLSIIETTQTAAFKDLLASELQQSMSVDVMISKIEEILDARLSELTPLIVKDIVQAMIRKHLGWLVVWGGVFGGLIGAVATVIS